MNVPCKYNSDFVLYSDGRMFSVKSNIFLKTRVRRHGYLAYLFRDITDNKRRAFSIHRLLAEHFIPNPKNYPEINHINGIKTDNRIENLEWCTRSHNCKHAVDTGLHEPLRGETHPKAKVTEKQVLEIRKLKKEGYRNFELQEIFKTTKDTIQDIVRRKSWKHI